MLVLTRKKDETIQIKLPNGEVVTVMVTKLKAGQASIGIDAPEEVKIYRTELLA